MRKTIARLRALTVADVLQLAGAGALSGGVLALTSWAVALTVSGAAAFVYGAAAEYRSAA